MAEPFGHPTASRVRDVAGPCDFREQGMVSREVLYDP